MEDVRSLMRDHYIKYASYVVLERAIPRIEDGFKPVQRRILYTLREMDDGKLHKVANVAGQTMTLHPHGDAAIIDALINLANKGYVLDQQGNFGNIFTGDPAAAARYIETRLSPLARETLFNPALTAYSPSYDGRQQEPVALPAKIPVLLIQGADGIAVGMSTHILPHNFVEALEAEIAILEKRPFKLMPDFPTGGIADVSEYAKGKGKVRLRAKIEVRDPKTLVITEICYGTTTESLIRSVDEAAKKGKIKIESINDYTADKVEIEIKLPRGQYAEELIESLYGYTECEVSLSSQIVVIKENMPWETDVDAILHYHVEKLQGYIRQEYELERDNLKEKIFEKTLEQIFIENRMYKKIENVGTYEKIHESIAESLEPFHKALLRVPTHDDREKLLSIPIRRISRFDIEKNQGEIATLLQDLAGVEKELKQITKATIRYLKGLIQKYGKNYPRKTSISTLEEVDKRAIATRAVKVGFDKESGFVGTKVSGDSFECTNYDKVLVMLNDGSYSVINIPEKQYVQTDGNKVVHVGVADKKTVFAVVYRDPKTKQCYGKRFVVDKFILDKGYRFIDDGMEFLLLTIEPGIVVDLQFVAKAGQKVKRTTFALDDVTVKGVTAKGVRLSPKEVKKVTIAGSKRPEQPDLFA